MSLTLSDILRHSVSYELETAFLSTFHFSIALQKTYKRAAALQKPSCMLLEQVPVLSTPSLGPSRASNGTRGGPATQQKKSPSQDNASTPGSSNSVINGSSTSSAGPTSRKRQADSAKRKRTSMSATPSDDHDQPTTPTTGSHTVKEKKKKASRACCHCQKVPLLPLTLSQSSLSTVLIHIQLFTRPT